MCLSYLKKSRNWALFLSGFAFAVFITSLALFLAGIEITIFGVTITKQLLIIRTAFALIISFLFLKYAEKASSKRRK